LNKLSQSNDKLTGASLLLTPQPPVSSPSLAHRRMSSANLKATSTAVLTIATSVTPTLASSNSTQTSPRGDATLSATSQLEMIQENKARYAKYKFASTQHTYSECVYEGEWLQYEMEGSGRMQYPSGSIFEGDWSRNQPVSIQSMSIKRINFYININNNRCKISQRIILTIVIKAWARRIF